MKTIILILAVQLLIANQLLSQEESHTREITFVNNSVLYAGNHSLTVRVYPVVSADKTLQAGYTITELNQKDLSKLKNGFD